MTNTSKKFSFAKILLASACMFMLNPAYALDKKAAIDKVLDSINIQKIADNFANTAQKEAAGNSAIILQNVFIENKNLSKERKQALVADVEKDILPRVQAKAISIFTQKDFKKQFIEEQAQQYGQYYSAEELEGLATFYQSSLGKKFLESQPKIAQTTLMNIMQKYMPMALNEARQISQKEISALK